MTKSEREEHEYKSLFTDERYAKKAWKEFMGESLQSPGKPLPTQFDKNDNPTRESDIDAQAYKNVKARLEKEGKDREPMQAELIVEAAVIRARFQDSTLNIMLERTAGKVKDEVTVNSNPYEDLTDDELETLMAYRESKKAAQEQNTSVDNNG